VLHLLFNVLGLRSPGIAVPIYFVLTFVLSMATYRLIEGPFIKIGRRFSD
jgi:peptidoglycan/LPS O-acetylase OafA/YrhL